MAAEFGPAIRPNEKWGPVTANYIVMEPARNSSCVLAVEQPHFKPLREGADSHNYILLAVWSSWTQLYNKINAPDCEWLEIFRSRK